MSVVATASFICALLSSDVWQEKISYDAELLDTTAEQAVVLVMRKNCGVTPQIKKSKCVDIVKDDASRVCYVETPNGMWFVTKGYMEQMSVVYHRFD